MPSLANSGYVLLFYLIGKYFQMKILSLMFQSNSMIPQVIDDPKGTSIGSMDFDNPKVYGDITILDGLV